MSLSTPTTKSVSDNIVAQIQTSFGQTIPLLPKAWTRVMAKTVAAVFVLLYKYGGFMFLQMFVRYATLNETEINGRKVSPLLEWGRLIGVSDPESAARAEYIVNITVNNQTGTLPSGTQLIGEKNGVTYLTIGSVALNAATVTATVRASASQDGDGAGAIGNLLVGDTISFANALANVSRDTTIDSVVVTGVDGEAETSYRQRVIDRFQKRPQGGAYADYEQWGGEAAGIINVYPYTSASPGQVDVYCEASVASSGSPDGIPTASQLQAVLDIINQDANGLASRRNANAFVNSYPITRTGFDIEVQGISGVTNLASVQNSIEDGLVEYFVNAEPYIPGLSVPPRRDGLTINAILGIIETVVTAAGGTFTTATFALSFGGGNLQSYTLGEGEKAKVSVSFL